MAAGRVRLVRSAKGSAGLVVSICVFSHSQPIVACNRMRQSDQMQLFGAVLAAFHFGDRWTQAPPVRVKDESAGVRWPRAQQGKARPGWGLRCRRVDAGGAPGRWAERKSARSEPGVMCIEWSKVDEVGEGGQARKLRFSFAGWRWAHAAAHPIC